MIGSDRRPSPACALGLQVEVAVEAALARGNALRAARLGLLADEATAGGPGASAAWTALAAAGLRPLEEREA